MSTSLIKKQQNILKLTANCCWLWMWGVMATRGGVWPFRVKNGPKKNHYVSRDGTVAEGEFTVSKM
jgi:hypothetical protein